jgi:hypothetical protein
MSYRFHAAVASIGLVFTFCLAVPFEASAQGPDGVRHMTRLGGSTRFTAPVRSVDALRRTFGRRNIQNDVGTVLKEAGVPQLQQEVLRNLTEGTVTQVTITPGTRLEWMALRRNGPRILRTLQWDGRRPFRAFQFEIDDRVNTYTFIVPEDCGNLAVLRQEPSRIAAREREEAARAEAARAAAAKAEADRAAAAKAEADRAAAAKAAADKAAADKAAADKAAADKAAADKAAAEKAAADAARQAEADRLAAENRALAVRPFIAGYFGKQQRQYDEIDPAGLGAAVNPVRRYGDPLVGAKFGVALRLGDSKWSFNPAIGFAGNLEESDRSSLLLDTPIVFNFQNGMHLGSGLSLWDFNHDKITTFSWLGEAGFPIWKSEPKKHQLDFQVEWRQFFDRGSDPDTNYMFWGGLRYLFK